MVLLLRVDMLHPLYQLLFEVVNDERLSDTLSALLKHEIFDWVSTYVITDGGKIVLQRVPASRKRKACLQSFGGGDYPRNLLFMLNKLRLELLDESSIALTSDVQFCTSPLYITANGATRGLLQVVMVSEVWLQEQQLWSPEWARNHRDRLKMWDISQFHDTLRASKDTRERLQN